MATIDIDPETDAPSQCLVIGENALASRICRSLERSWRVIHLDRPDDAALSAAAATQPDAVAIALHDDVAALRYALAVAHLQPTTRIVVTIFDRTIAARLQELLPRATVTSPADVAAPILAITCLEALAASGEIAPGQRYARRRSVLRRVGRLVPSLRTHDSHTQLLLVGAVGLCAVLFADWTWLTFAEHEPAIPAFLEAARVVATVGPGPTEPSTTYAAFSACAIVATIVLTAMFTAGLVQRLLEPGLLAILGNRSVPKSDHVIVVGMGQVGIRLCAELRRLGVPVVGVERDARASQLRLARALRIPVVVGHGIDRADLERVHLRRALAIAAVGSNELDNIAVAIAASAVSPDTRVVLRAGEQEAIAETRSLLPLGATIDVMGLAASFMARTMRAPAVEGSPADLQLVAAQAECSPLEDRACIHQMP